MIDLEDCINNVNSFKTSTSEETEHRSNDECQTEQLTRNIPTEIVAI